MEDDYMNFHKTIVALVLLITSNCQEASGDSQEMAALAHASFAYAHEEGQKSPETIASQDNSWKLCGMESESLRIADLIAQGNLNALEKLTLEQLAPARGLGIEVKGDRVAHITDTPASERDRLVSTFIGGHNALALVAFCALTAKTPEAQQTIVNICQALLKKGLNTGTKVITAMFVMDEKRESCHDFVAEDSLEEFFEQFLPDNSFKKQLLTLLSQYPSEDEDTYTCDCD